MSKEIHKYIEELIKIIQDTWERADTISRERGYYRSILIWDKVYKLYTDQIMKAEQAKQKREELQDGARRNRIDADGF